MARIAYRGERIDIGGRALRVVRAGPDGAARQGPLVVCEHGAFGCAADWAVVQEKLAARGLASLAYDRAGLGWSDLCQQSCTPSSLAMQLHTLLHNTGIGAPYVLVGHSFGGLIVQAFAHLYPHETAGLVLVDPLDPAEWTPITDEQRRMIRQGIRLSRRGALAG